MIFEIISILVILGIVGYNIFTNHKIMSIISGLILISYIFIVKNIIPKLIV